MLPFNCVQEAIFPWIQIPTTSNCEAVAHTVNIHAINMLETRAMLLF